MTLKERAEKSHKEWVNSDDCEINYEESVSKEFGTEYAAVYIAGFREAIRLAIEIVRDNRLPELADPDTWTHNSVCSDIEFSVRALAEESK